MRALAGALAAGAVALGALFTAPSAHAYASAVRSLIWWSGPECIPVRVSNAPDGYGWDIKQACGGHAERSYYAVPGQWVGADPVGFDETLAIGCQLWIDGELRLSDYAPPGDHHDVNCLRQLLPGSYGPVA